MLVQRLAYGADVVAEAGSGLRVGHGFRGGHRTTSASAVGMEPAGRNALITHPSPISACIKSLEDGAVLSEFPFEPLSPSVEIDAI